MRDIYHNVLVTQVANPAVSTTTITSSAIDLKGFNGAIVTFTVGQSADALSGSVYWTLKLQESNDDADYTDVAAEDISSGDAAAVINSSSLDEAAYSFGYHGSKRYLKGIATPSGSHSSGTPIGIIALRGIPGYAPVL